MTNSRFNRRDFLASMGGTALAYALDGTAQPGPRTTITVRIDRDLAVLDPADPHGPVGRQRHARGVSAPDEAEAEFLGARARRGRRSQAGVADGHRVPPEARPDVHRRLRRNDRRRRQVLVRAHRPAAEGRRQGGDVQGRLALPAGGRGQEQVRRPHRAHARAGQPVRRRDRRRLRVHRPAQGRRAARRGLRDQARRLRSVPAHLARAAERRHAAPQSGVHRPQAALRRDRHPLHLRCAHDRSRAAVRRARLRGARAGRRRAAALRGRAQGRRATQHRLRVARHERREGAAVRSARPAGDPPRARRRPDAGGRLQRQGAAAQHAAAAADHRPLARGAGLQAQRGRGEEPAGGGGRVEPQAQAADPEPGQLPEHGAGGARAARRRRDHGRGRRAGGRHLLEFRQGRHRQEHRPLHHPLQRQARSQLHHAVVRRRPDRQLELAALEQSGIRRPVRAVGRRSRSGQAPAAGGRRAAADGQERAPSSGSPTRPTPSCTATGCGPPPCRAGSTGNTTTSARRPDLAPGAGGSRCPREKHREPQRGCAISRAASSRPC